jgi:hypothetical protein
LICLYKLFLFQFWYFSWIRKSRISTYFIRRKVDDHVHKTTPLPSPSTANSVSWVMVHLVFVAKLWSPLTLSATLMDHFVWFQASAAKYVRFSLSWDITQRIVVFFLTTFRYNLSVPSSRANKLKIWIFDSWGPIGYTEMSVRNYQYTQGNIPKERRFSGSLPPTARICLLKTGYPQLPSHFGP